MKSLQLLADGKIKANMRGWFLCLSWTLQSHIEKMNSLRCVWIIKKLIDTKFHIDSLLNKFKFYKRF